MTASVLDSAGAVEFMPGVEVQGMQVRDEDSAALAEGVGSAEEAGSEEAGDEASVEAGSEEAGSEEAGSEGAAEEAGSEEGAAEEGAAEEATSEEAAPEGAEAWNSLATAWKAWVASPALPLGQMLFTQLWTLSPSFSTTHLTSAMLLEQASLALETSATQANRQAGGVARAVPARRAKTVEVFIFVCVEFESGNAWDYYKPTDEAF